MALFDAKNFNAEVFGRYINRIPDLVKTELLKSGVLRTNQELANMLPAQSGGNYITIPLKGLIDGEALNYDGVSNLATTSTKTYTQSHIVIGRMKGWSEKQFSKELTGIDFMDNVAQQVASYKEKLDQKTLLSILKGIFAMADTKGQEFVESHTLDVSGEAEPEMGATTMNTAIQKATGDNDGVFSFAIMHSLVATKLKNLQILEYLKYTDANGIQRDLKLAQLNGITVFVDDGMPVEEVEAEYELTSDVALDNSKTYYTRTGSGTSGSPYVYTVVATPDVDDIATYYEVAAKAYKKYTTYVLGTGAFDYADCGAEYPYEIARDAETNGGVDKLYMRQRKIFSPYGISFTKQSMATSSPTNAELENGANWEVVNDGAVSNKTYLDLKAIPIARIITRG